MRKPLPQHGRVPNRGDTPGVKAPAHILTPSATVRRIVNMTALTVAHAGAKGAASNVR